MAAKHNTTQHSPVTILLTTAQRRRLESAARVCGVTPLQLVRNVTLGCVRSIVDGERARSRR